MVSFRCFGGFVFFVSVFRWFRFGVSVVSAVPVVSFRWFRFGVSGFSTCRSRGYSSTKALTAETRDLSK